MIRAGASIVALAALPAVPAMPVLRPTEADAVTLEYLCDNIWIVGDVDEVTRKLHRLYQEVGGFGTLLVIGHEWLPVDNWRRSMMLLAKEVVPRLNELTQPAAVAD